MSRFESHEFGGPILQALSAQQNKGTPQRSRAGSGSSTQCTTSSGLGQALERQKTQEHQTKKHKNIDGGGGASSRSGKSLFQPTNASPFFPSNADSSKSAPRLHSSHEAQPHTQQHTLIHM